MGPDDQDSDEDTSPATGTTDDEAAAAVSPAPVTFPIVGIGASAGGLEALERFTGHLGSDGMAFIVLQHLAPGHESVLAEILSRSAHLPVRTIHDGLRVEPNAIYVAPSSVDLALHNGVLLLMPPSREPRGARHSIDAFLRTLAADQGPRAVGVLLSGAGSDGTQGLRAIKEAGGLTFAQQPSTANQPSMPQTAIDAGYADFCLSPEGIGDELGRLARGGYVITTARPALDDDTRGKLFVLLRRAFGVDFATYKCSTLERRIERRMTLHKLQRLEDYLLYVQSNASELNALYSDLLINVTEFFRDKAPFDALKAHVLPALVEGRPPDRALRIWVAGCATGEEAYSIAISVMEFLEERSSWFRVQVFATDIDEHSLSRARLAVYPTTIDAEVSQERLQRFFTRTDKGYQVNRAIRDMVVFARHNLGKDPPFSRIDLVSCRNVLIYLQPALQRKILRVLHYALNPTGFLLLGTSETVGDAAELYSLVDSTNKLYAKKSSRVADLSDASFAGRPDAIEPIARRLEGRAPPTVLQLAERTILEQYGPPGVVVDERFDILQYRGKTGRFFEPAPGLASASLLKLARPELLSGLKGALEKARSQKARVLTPPVDVTLDGNTVEVTVDVTPLPPAPAGTLYLVLFLERAVEQREPPAPSSPIADGDDPRLRTLERELLNTREFLQTTIEELEATNEELQSANEELQSANEELQSTNEELETSKEELQSTNEELITLNEELQNRMVQLSLSTDDLENVLAAASPALLLVGADLRIRRFSAAAERLLSLVPGDVGRPLAYVRTVVMVRDIEQLVAEAIHNIASREQKVRSADGDWFTMRVSPYRTADGAIRGAVVEFMRVLPGASEEAPRPIGGLAGAIFNELPVGLAVLDERVRVTWANATLLALLGVGPDILGRPLEDLWPGREHDPDSWRRIEQAAIGGLPFEDAKTTVEGPSQVRRDLVLSARRIPQEEGRTPATLLTVNEYINSTRAP